MKENINIAIIGASEGQKGLYLAAKKMGIYTLGFSWEEGAIYKGLADEFFPISITETDEIVEICKSYNVKGVVSSGSDFTAKQVSIISEKLGLPGIKTEDFNKASDKSYVRQVSSRFSEFEQVKYSLYNEDFVPKFPCIIKPVSSGGKVGLSMANNKKEYCEAIAYAKESKRTPIIVEEYIDGIDLTVETISSNGKHYVIQTCEAENTGMPHFVEIAHHLPANISKDANNKIRTGIPKLLEAINFRTGAANIDLKVCGDKVYLIEVNLRASGGNFASSLVYLSTGVDYNCLQIEASMGRNIDIGRVQNVCAGDYYLCKQTEYLRPLFDLSENKEWLIERKIVNTELKEVKINGDRENYIIYMSDHRITLEDV